MYMFVIVIASYMHESMVDMIALMLANYTNEGGCWWFRGLMVSGGGDRGGLPNMPRMPLKEGTLRG